MGGNHVGWSQADFVEALSFGKVLYVNRARPEGATLNVYNLVQRVAEWRIGMNQPFSVGTNHSSSGHHQITELMDQVDRNERSGMR